MGNDNNPGPGDGYAQYFTPADTVMFFTAANEQGQGGPWKTNGTVEGTVEIKTINTSTFYSHVAFRYLAYIDSLLYFRASDGTMGSELWISDGTTEGTFPIEIEPGIRGSAPQDFTKFGDQVFFMVQTDGTMLLKDIIPGPRYPSIEDLMAYAGKAWFTAIDPDQGRVVWQTDGTSEGTRVVEGSPVNVTEIKAYNGVLYIVAGNQAYGYEPYIYDLRQEQFISFDPLGEKLYGDEPFMLNASSTAGLPLDYPSSHPEVVTIDGDMIAIKNAGETTITATQPGNEIYSTASATPPHGIEGKPLRNSGRHNLQ